ncbi:MAG: ATP-binding protein, partial [Devosia sp.]
YREYAGLIHESGGLLLDLINDILDMSKIEAGRFELALEHFHAGETVDACARLLKQKAENAGLLLHTAVEPTAPIEADKRAVKQILLNLVSNAIKFTPRGGVVTLGVAETAHGVAISVSDTGIGIPAADLPRLGKPFEQATQDATLAKSGTGLGLALVRSLAELHGGEMTIASELNKGTTVTVYLPKAHLAVAA